MLVCGGTPTQNSQLMLILLLLLLLMFAGRLGLEYE